MSADTSDKTLRSLAAGRKGVCRRVWQAVCVCTCLSVAGWSLITEGGGGVEEAHFGNMVIR